MEERRTAEEGFRRCAEKQRVCIPGLVTVRLPEVEAALRPFATEALCPTEISPLRLLRLMKRRVVQMDWSHLPSAPSALRTLPPAPSAWWGNSNAPRRPTAPHSKVRSVPALKRPPLRWRRRR